MCIRDRSCTGRRLLRAKQTVGCTLRGTVAEGQLPFAWTKLDGEDERDDAAGNAGDADRRAQKRHDGGAVAARYKHALGGLSVRFFVGRSVRNLRILHSFSAHGRPALAHLFFTGGLENAITLPHALLRLNPTSSLRSAMAGHRAPTLPRLWSGGEGATASSPSDIRRPPPSRGGGYISR